MLAARLLLLFLLPLLSLADSNCQAKGVCEVCTSEESQEGACLLTGKRQRFECWLEDQSTAAVWESCTRTPAEEEFLVVRWQGLWLVIGAWAFVSLRRQKRRHASLFDQRKMAGNTTAETSIEMQPLSRNNTNGMEVV